MQLVQDVLDIFGEQVVNNAKRNLADKNDTKALANSLSYEVKVSKNSFQFTLNALNYASFVDQGVQGKSSSLRAPNSPFKFGSGTGKKGGLTEGVNGWVGRKRIQFKDRKTGRFLSYKATAFLIARSIYQKGQKPSNFLTDAFNKEFRVLPKQLIEAYGLDAVRLLQTSLRNNTL
jgi:hypothetical protein